MDIYSFGTASDVHPFNLISWTNSRFLNLRDQHWNYSGLFATLTQELQFLKVLARE